MIETPLLIISLLAVIPISIVIVGMFCLTIEIVTGVLEEDND